MSSKITLDTRPLQDALRKRKLTPARTGKAVMAGLFTLEALAKLNVRENFNQGTGDLASRWDTSLDSATANNAEGHTAPLMIYARIQELGGVIEATNGPYLTFQTEDGAWVRVRAVTIPARPYLRPAADSGKSDIVKSIIDELSDVIERGR